METSNTKLLSLRYWLDLQTNKTVTWILRHQAIVSFPWETTILCTRAFSSALISFCLLVHLSVCLSLYLPLCLSVLPTLAPAPRLCLSLVAEASSNRLILGKDRKAVLIHRVSETQKRTSRKLYFIFFDTTFCSIANTSAWAFVAFTRFERWPVNV